VRGSASSPLGFESEAHRTNSHHRALTQRTTLNLTTLRRAKRRRTTATTHTPQPANEHQPLTHNTVNTGVAPL
jgi:hypothetical protein